MDISYLIACIKLGILTCEYAQKHGQHSSALCECTARDAQKDRCMHECTTSFSLYKYAPGVNNP